MRLSEICVERPVFAFMLIMFLVVLGVLQLRRARRGPVPPQRSCHRQRPGRAAGRQSGRGHVAGRHAARRGHRLCQRHRRNAARSSAKAPPTSSSPSFWSATSARPSEDVREKVSGAMRKPAAQRAAAGGDEGRSRLRSRDHARHVRAAAGSGADRDRRQAGPPRARDRGRSRRRGHQRRAEPADQRLSGSRQALRLQPDRAGCPAARSRTRISRLRADGWCAAPPKSAFAPWAAWKTSPSSTTSSSRTWADRPFGCAMSATPRTAWRRSAPLPSSTVKPAVTLEIRRQTGTNTVQVVDAIKQQIDVIQKQLPPRRDASTW